MELVVAAFFSFLGAFAGGYFARRTEYQKWLRQNRSETFAEFLGKLDDAWLKASDVLHDPRLSKPEQHIERDIKVSDLYLPVENYGRVVRLYLPKSKRQEFSTLVHDVHVQHSSVNLGDSRIKKVNENIDRIQSILEEVLDETRTFSRA